MGWLRYRRAVMASITAMAAAAAIGIEWRDVKPTDELAEVVTRAIDDSQAEMWPKITNMIDEAIAQIDSPSNHTLIATKTWVTNAIAEGVATVEMGPAVRLVTPSGSFYQDATGVLWRADRVIQAEPFEVTDISYVTNGYAWTVVTNAIPGMGSWTILSGALTQDGTATYTLICMDTGGDTWEATTEAADDTATLRFAWPTTRPGMTRTIGFGREVETLVTYSPTDRVMYVSQRMTTNEVIAIASPLTNEFLRTEVDPTVPAWAKAANPPQTMTTNAVIAIASPLTNGFIRTEVDPTVPEWAKSPTPPTGITTSDVAGIVASMSETGSIAWSNLVEEIAARAEEDPTVPAWAKEPNPPATITTNDVIGIVTRGAPTGEWTWEFSGPDLPQGVDWRIMELNIASNEFGYLLVPMLTNMVFIPENAPYYYPTQQNVLTNFFSLTDPEEWDPSTGSWTGGTLTPLDVTATRMPVETNVYGFVKRDELAVPSLASLTNSVTNIVTQTHLSDWTFAPDGGYAVIFSQESHEWVLWLGSTNLGMTATGGTATPDDMSLEFDVADEYDVPTIGGKVYARRKALNDLGFALAGDVQDVAIDNVSITKDPLGRMEVADLSGANLSVTAPNLLVADGISSVHFRSVEDIVDTDTLYVTPNGRLSVVEQEDAHTKRAWIWDGKRGRFDNAYVQICRQIMPVAQTNDWYAKLGSNLVMYIKVDNVERTAELMATSVEPPSGGPPLDNYAVWSEAVPPNSMTNTFLYIGTIYYGRQAEGIYTMPICVLWE